MESLPQLKFRLGKIFRQSAIGRTGEFGHNCVPIAGDNIAGEDLVSRSANCQQSSKVEVIYEPIAKASGLRPLNKRPGLPHGMTLPERTRIPDALQTRLHTWVASVLDLIRQN